MTLSSLQEWIFERVGWHQKKAEQEMQNTVPNPAITRYPPPDAGFFEKLDVPLDPRYVTHDEMNILMHSSDGKDAQGFPSHYTKLSYRFATPEDFVRWIDTVNEHMRKTH